MGGPDPWNRRQGKAFHPQLFERQHGSLHLKSGANLYLSAACGVPISLSVLVILLPCLFRLDTISPIMGDRSTYTRKARRHGQLRVA